MENQSLSAYWRYNPALARYTHPYKCSHCGRKYDDATNFCPNCGAKMNEIKEENYHD